MIGSIKKAFPSLYDYYQHIKRVRGIKKIEKRKYSSFEEQINLLEKSYYKYIGHHLDWNNLCSYTEKMQWEKVYDKNPLKTKLADKYEVRKWVSEAIGDDYLIPLIGVWNRFDDIDFSKLPNQFVIKTNHGSGTNYIVKNKDAINYRRLRRMVADWMNTDFGYAEGLEMHYSGIKPKILVEKYMESDKGELQDYKFLCFDGKPYYCWVDMGRYSNHTRNVYDLDWNLQPWNQEEYGNYHEPIPRPTNFTKMVEIATILSEGFSHVRVDLYNIQGKIYFGEMTFTNGRGFDRIIPEEYDYKLGSLWHLGI